MLVNNDNSNFATPETKLARIRDVAVLARVRVRVRAIVIAIIITIIASTITTLKTIN